MKNLILAGAISLIATSAFAGALTDPIVEPDVIIEAATTSSSQGIIVPIFFLIMLGAAMTGGSSMYTSG